MNKAFLLFALIFSSANSSCYAQKSRIDSLESLLTTSQNRKSEILYQLSREWIYTDRNVALQYVDQGLSLAKEQGDSLGIVRGARMRGHLYRALDKVDESIKVLNEILPVAERLRHNDKEVLKEYISILSNLALSSTFSGLYDKALEYNFLSLSIHEKEGNKTEASVVLNNIGLVYFKIKNYDKALEFYNQSLSAISESEHKVNLDRVLVNIGLTYMYIGNYDLAKEYIVKGINVCNDNCTDDIKVEAEFGLGLSNFRDDKIDAGIKHFELSLKLARKSNNLRFEAENLIYIAQINLLKGDLKSAEKFLMECLAIGRSTGYNQLLLDTYEQFGILYNKAEDFKNAAVYQQKYIQLYDSIYNQELLKNLPRIQTEFEERQNIATIAENNAIIKQQRDLNFAIAVIAILAGLLILVLQRGNRVTKQVNAKLSEAKEIIQEQNQLLAIKNKDLDKEVEKKTIDLEKANLSLKQVNDELDNFIYKTSHDIRGPLASLKGMCNVALMDVTDPIALDYLRKLDATAERLNTILTRLLIVNQINNSKLSITKIDFHSIVNDVIMLEKKKGLPSKLVIRNNVNPEITIKSDKELLRIVLENLIDNAIKFHNDSDRMESFVEVQVVPLADESVKVRVIDNGIGISESNPSKLFQMFFRASERSEIGGIGLYIVKTATAKIGGKVGLVTTPEGYTEFYVLLPTVLTSTEAEFSKHEFI